MEKPKPTILGKDCYAYEIDPECTSETIVASCEETCDVDDEQIDELDLDEYHIERVREFLNNKRVCISLTAGKNFVYYETDNPDKVERLAKFLMASAKWMRGRR